MFNEDNNIDLQYLKLKPTIRKFEVRSRHIKRKTYKCFLEYKPDAIGPLGIVRYCCDCANGLRTFDCCSHVAAIIYYLSHGRYKAKIIRPAEFLNATFRHDDIEPVINSYSDED